MLYVPLPFHSPPKTYHCLQDYINHKAPQGSQISVSIDVQQIPKCLGFLMLYLKQIKSAIRTQIIRRQKRNQRDRCGAKWWLVPSVAQASKVSYARTNDSLTT